MNITFWGEPVDIGIGEIAKAIHVFVPDGYEDGYDLKGLDRDSMFPKYLAQYICQTLSVQPNAVVIKNPDSILRDGNIYFGVSNNVLSAIDISSDIVTSSIKAYVKKRD